MGTKSHAVYNSQAKRSVIRMLLKVCAGMFYISASALKCIGHVIDRQPLQSSPMRSYMGSVK